MPILLTLLQVFGSGMDHLHRDELEATSFKAGDDDTNEATLDTVGLE